MALLFDTSYLFVRALKKLVRNPILIFFSLFQPIIFLVLFTQLFSLRSTCSRAFPAGVSYLEYASAGILMQNAFSSALQSGTSIVEDLNSGFLQKMLVTQVSRPAILLGRLATDAFRVTVQSVIILALAYALGFRLGLGDPGRPAHPLHHRLLRARLVGNLARARPEDEELGDGLRDRSLPDLPAALHEHGTRPARLHAVMDAGRLQASTR